MPFFTRLGLMTLFCAVLGSLSAQNLVLTAQNPNHLYVCGQDTFRLTLQNNSAASLTNLQLTLTLPTDITYVAGSITGATELNLSNPSAPVFTLADLASGASITLSGQERASCNLLAAINSGTVFANAVQVTYNGGTQQLATLNYPVETGLLLITNVSPTPLSGENGQVLIRTITVKNTRQGPIEALRFTDQHFPGLLFNLAGIGGVNSSPVFFEATVPGTYFTAFGDGDNLLEFNEIVTFTEEITIADCGTPPITNTSDIRLAWGCGNASCQYDEKEAVVQIQPSTQNPDLQFITHFAEPNSLCGTVPSVQEVLIVNNGNVAANEVNLYFSSVSPSALGFEPQSAAYNAGAGWLPLAVQNSVSTTLESCQLEYAQGFSIVVPTVIAHDTVRVRFQSFFCSIPCLSSNAPILAQFQYSKACPASDFVNGIFYLAADTLTNRFKSKVYFDIGHCLESDSTYNFSYWTQAARLLTDTGYLRVVFDLPTGLYLDTNCYPQLDGQSSLQTTVETTPTGTLTTLTFDLPFSVDSVADDFCIRYVCTPTLQCDDPIPNVPPRGANYMVFPAAANCPRSCQLHPMVTTLITPTLDQSLECGVSTCDAFTLLVNADCLPGGGGGGGGEGGGIGGGGEGNVQTYRFDSYRLNLGLRDDNDDRQADNGQLANPAAVRRDRFLVGDTMRTEMEVAIVEGTLSNLNFRSFIESWQSDSTLGGADRYDITAGKLPFVNYDSLQYLSGRLILKVGSTGVTYACTIVPPNVRSDQHIITILEPNIRPEQVIDRISSMFNQFNLSISNFTSTGCFPTGYVLKPGDTLLFQADFRFCRNFTPMAANNPPLINFRNAICTTNKVFAWNDPTSCLPSQRRQYSGFQELLRPPVTGILPCALSNEIFPLRYRIRIARGNLFPYEVRPLAKLFNLYTSLPGQVPLVSSKLKFLRLQETVNLFNDQNIMPLYDGSDSVRLDLSPFFQQPLDEGFSLEISNQFAATCGYSGPQVARSGFTVRYPNLCFQDPLERTYRFSNLNGYLNATPRLEFVAIDTSLETATSLVQADFSISNTTAYAAPNTWLVLENIGDLADIELLILPSQQPVPSIGGVYQLGELSSFNQISLRIRARNNACSIIKVRLRYGWDCEPLNNPATMPCGNYVHIISIKPLNPELELVITEQPDNVPICLPSDYLEVEIYNANQGFAYDILASVKLPPGLSIYGGSSQISYPAGSPWVNIPDPAALPGHVFSWSTAAASAALAAQGLASVSATPLNSLHLRFRVIAECGFVANAQPIYGAEGLKPCGVSTNKLHKPGLPLALEGFAPDYDVDAQLTLADLNLTADCGETVALQASITLGGAPAAGDSVYVLLPAGVHYVAGSYQPGTNAAAGPPQLTTEGIQVALPASGNAGTIVRFTFSVRYEDAANCIDQSIVLQARQKAEVFCPLNNQNCNIYIATGEDILFLPIQNPDLLLSNFVPTATNGAVTFSALLENVGAGAAQQPVVQFYLDQNHNGQVEANEPQVGTAQLNQSLLPGTLASLTGSLNLTAAQLCNLIALLPAGPNCACTDRTVVLGNNATILQAIGVCGLMSVPLAVDSLAGGIYTWLTPQGLGCTNCAHTTYTSPPTVQAGDLVTLVLLEQTGNCTVEHRFDVQFGGSLGVETADQVICQGESATLIASSGGTYVWSGPGISNPGLATQVVQPAQSTTYSVSVTFAGGCTGSDQVLVTVLPRDSVDLGMRTTCAGQPVSIFGQLTEVPGLYTQVIPQANGCDSVLYIRLEIVPTETSEVRPICAGASTMVFDSLFTQAGSLCKTFATATGCDSTHCVNVSITPNPVVPAQDSVIGAAGQEITLGGAELDIFSTYVWTPATGLSCITCPHPVATPDSSTNYIVVVADDHGCLDSVTYRILVFPPCDPHRLAIPNAFTPNGDNSNDIFRVVPFEGFEMVQELTIYDRWGQKIYTGSGATAAWDGTIDGKPAPADVYVWRLVINCNGEQIPLTMDVTLLR